MIGTSKYNASAIKGKGFFLKVAFKKFPKYFLPEIKKIRILLSLDLEISFIYWREL